MKASKNSYLISIYLKSNQGKPITLVWQQDFQPTFPEITRKTVMHCVEKKYASDLLENTATAVVRMIDENNKIEELGNYQMEKETLQKEFFEYIELVL